MIALQFVVKSIEPSNIKYAWIACSIHIEQRQYRTLNVTTSRVTCISIHAISGSILDKSPIKC